MKTIVTSILAGIACTFCASAQQYQAYSNKGKYPVGAKQQAEWFDFRFHLSDVWLESMDK